MLSNPSCFVGEAKTYPESCILPAGKTYYLLVMSTANAGGPFTLMVDAPPGTAAQPAGQIVVSPGTLQQAVQASSSAP